MASTPSKLNKGAKTTRIIDAAKKIGLATSFPASFTDDLKDWASSCELEVLVFNRLKIFSIITTEPSTNIPIATAIPPSDIKFADSPMKAMMANAITMAIGMVMSTRNVAPTFIKNRARTMVIKTKAMVNALTTVEIAFSIRFA